MERAAWRKGPPPPCACRMFADLRQLRAWRQQLQEGMVCAKSDPLDFWIPYNDSNLPQTKGGASCSAKGTRGPLLILPRAKAHTQCMRRARHARSRAEPILRAAAAAPHAAPCSRASALPDSGRDSAGTGEQTFNIGTSVALFPGSSNFNNVRVHVFVAYLATAIHWHCSARSRDSADTTRNLCSTLQEGQENPCACRTCARVLVLCSAHLSHGVCVCARARVQTSGMHSGSTTGKLFCAWSNGATYDRMMLDKHRAQSGASG